MDKRPGGRLRQGFAGLGSSVLLPGMNLMRQMPSKGLLVPGILLVLAVMALFWSISRPTLGETIATVRNGPLVYSLYMPLSFWIVAALISLGSVYFVYRMCGKRRPWWALAVPAVMSAVLMQDWFGNAWITLFHGFLAGGIPSSKTWGDVPMTILFPKVLIGVGLGEELWKAIPVGVCVWLGLQIQGPFGAKVGVREPLDGILVGVVCGTVFAVSETMGQYVQGLLLGHGANLKVMSNLLPAILENQIALLRGNGLSGADLASALNDQMPIAVQRQFLKLSGYEGLLLTLARLLGDIFGHAAYTGYIGYFIGLAVMRPQQWLKLLAIGFGGMILVHTLWDVVQSDAIRTGLGVLAFASLIGAILKARQLSPDRANNFASMVSPGAAPADLAQAPARAQAPAGDLAVVADGVYHLQLGPKILRLSAGTQLRAGDIGALTPFDGGAWIAEVVRRDPSSDILGLRNASTQVWTMTVSSPEGMVRHDVPPGKTMRLIRQSRVNFGPVEGVVR